MWWEAVRPIGGADEVLGPGVRWGHTCNAVEGGKCLYVFGGYGAGKCQTNDVHVFDTEQQIWKHVVTSGNPPSGRDSHSCSSWKNKLIVIGGEDSSDCYLSDVHILDTEKRTWNNIAPVNWGPSARFSVAGDCLDERKGIHVLIGGCNQSLEALGDIYYFNTDMPMINGLLAQRKERSIKRELKRKCQEEYAPRERSEKVNDVTGLRVASDPIQSEFMQQSSQAEVHEEDFVIKGNKYT